MNLRLKLSVAYLAVLSLPAFSQTFWTEDFGTGCNQGQLATAWAGPNGSWTMTSTGTNAAESNQWYISATENGNAPGQCGSGCGSDRSLHVGAIDVGFGADPGAAYYEGIAAFCGFFPCGATSKRIKSPTINCTGQSAITVSFAYIEGGNAIDNATFWYFDGSTWTQQADMAKTFSAGCSPQGLWTSYTVNLPASADNNPSVKIGFRWINNDDGDATDPSFAVDDIVLSGTATTGDTTPPVVLCPGPITFEVTGTCAEVLPNVTALVEVSDDQDPSPVLTQSPEPGTVIGGLSEVIVTATDASGNQSTCTVVVNVVDIAPPAISCPPSVVVEIPSGNSSADLTFDPVEATDNCGLASVTNSFTGTDNASGAYPVGTTIVTYTATDLSGNSSTCSFSVTVTNGDCCPPDLNCDGVVGVADLLIFNANFGCTTGCVGDINGDGLVSVADMLLFNGAFGTTCP